MIKIDSSVRDALHRACPNDNSDDGDDNGDDDDFLDIQLYMYGLHILHDYAVVIDFHFDKMHTTTWPDLSMKNWLIESNIGEWSIDVKTIFISHFFRVSKKHALLKFQVDFFEH